jgi:SH3 domain-containing YSC84-like protein 1
VKRLAASAALILLTLLRAGPARAEGPAQTSAVDRELAEAKECYHGARFEETIERLESAVSRLDRERSLEVRRIRLADAYLHLGLAHLALGQRAQAKQSFREMLAVDGETRLDPDIYAPKVVELVEEARAELLAEEPALVESPPGKYTERLRHCHRLLTKALDDPEWIPRDLLLGSECVVLLPQVKKVAFAFGGRYGRGAVVCRAPEGKRWAPPLMVSLAGASFGFQVGGQSADVVMLMRAGADYLLRGKLTLGGDVSAAFGPGAKVATDGLLDAQVLTYARNRGVFAGVSFEGAVLKPDQEGNRAVYGEDVDPRQLVSSLPATLPEAAYRLPATLRKGASARIEARPQEPEASNPGQAEPAEAEAWSEDEAKAEPSDQSAVSAEAAEPTSEDLPPPEPRDPAAGEAAEVAPSGEPAPPVEAVPSEEGKTEPAVPEPGEPPTPEPPPSPEQDKDAATRR